MRGGASDGWGPGWVSLILGEELQSLSLREKSTSSGVYLLQRVLPPTGVPGTSPLPALPQMTPVSRHKYKSKPVPFPSAPLLHSNLKHGSTYSLRSRRARRMDTGCYLPLCTCRCEAVIPRARTAEVILRPSRLPGSPQSPQQSTKCGSNRSRLGPFSAPSGSAPRAAGPQLDPAPPAGTSTSCPPHPITCQVLATLPIAQASRFPAQTNRAFPNKCCPPSTDSSLSTGGVCTGTQTRPHPRAERSSQPAPVLAR